MSASSASAVSSKARMSTKHDTTPVLRPTETGFITSQGDGSRTWFRFAPARKGRQPVTPYSSVRVEISERMLSTAARQHTGPMNAQQNGAGTSTGILGLRLGKTEAPDDDFEAHEGDAITQDEVVAIETLEASTTPEPSNFSAPDSSEAAVRLLEIATRSADELITGAKTEAASLIASAQAEADQILAAARAEAEQVHADLDEQRKQQEDEIARLGQLEQEHREHMRGHLTKLLKQIES